MKGETEDAEIKQLQVLQHYNVTMDDLEEYKRNTPLIDYIKAAKKPIRKTEKGIIWLKNLEISK